MAGALPAAVRHYGHELRDVRNRRAHEAPFSDRAAQAAIDTVALVAVAIGAPATLLQTLGDLSVPDSPKEPRPTVARRAAKSAAPRPAPLTPESAAVRRDVNGVIVNAADLTADDVALERVLCPACGRKVFESWPLGWDAHAAHPCPGLAFGDEGERKAEYRRRFGHLFRDAGRAAKPAMQREVMRNVHGIHCPDHERVVREYVAAEARGEVGRENDAQGMAAEEHARLLLADGLKKGWLRCEAGAQR